MLLHSVGAAQVVWLAAHRWQERPLWAGGLSSTTLPMHAKISILVVEDDAGVADFLRRGLEAERYVVTVATNGVDGEVHALSGRFDLVLLDLMLPGRGGLEVLTSIHNSFPTLPVILLTARASVSELVLGLDSGATDYVTKPFSFEELAARVRAHLRRANRRVGDSAGFMRPE